jgi:hypothetical protein
LHINILEFLALTINLWLIIRHIHIVGARPGGHIVAAFADNTSAISWLHHAARSHTPPIRRLARFVSAFSLINDPPFSLQGTHIPGVDNSVADCLSRFRDAPTWASVITKQPLLSQCRPFQISRRLLSALSKTITGRATEVLYVELTTELLQIELCTLPAGWSTLALMTSLPPGAKFAKPPRS